MFEPFGRKDQRRWGQVYLRGLLTDGKRKSVEPMAARLGEDGNRQALANFITTSPWDPAHVRAALAWKMEPVIRPGQPVVQRRGQQQDLVRVERPEPLVHPRRTALRLLLRHRLDLEQPIPTAHTAVLPYPRSSTGDGAQPGRIIQVRSGRPA